MSDSDVVKVLKRARKRIAAKQDYWIGAAIKNSMADIGLVVVPTSLSFGHVSDAWHAEFTEPYGWWFACLDAAIDYAKKHGL